MALIIELSQLSVINLHLRMIISKHGCINYIVPCLRNEEDTLNHSQGVTKSVYRPHPPPAMGGQLGAPETQEKQIHFKLKVWHWLSI